MSSRGKPRIVVITIWGSGAAKAFTSSTSPFSIHLSSRSFAAFVIMGVWRSAAGRATHGSVSSIRWRLCSSRFGRSVSHVSVIVPKPFSRKISCAASSPSAAL